MKTKERKQYIVVILLVITTILFLAMGSYTHIKKQKNLVNNKKIETSLTSTQNIIEENIKSNEIQNKAKDIDESQEEQQIVTTFNGYDIIAKLEIPKIELETYVISEYSEKALGVAITKFYGANPNQIGNFCIAGHNYRINNNQMFHNLKKITNGDIILLTDLNNKKVEYKVYNIETVDPNETSCLSQKTNGKVEMTLITCTTDSSKRIVVKAIKNDN